MLNIHIYYKLSRKNSDCAREHGLTRAVNVFVRLRGALFILIQEQDLFHSTAVQRTPLFANNISCFGENSLARHRRRRGAQVPNSKSVQVGVDRLLPLPVLKGVLQPSNVPFGQIPLNLDRGVCRHVVRSPGLLHHGIEVTPQFIS